MPDTFADVAAFNLCEDGQLKQKLLEELDTHRRLKLFATQLKAEIESQKLQRKVQGRLPGRQYREQIESTPLAAA